MTKILLIGFGSRGDVQPLLALGHGLQASGYEVAIAAGSNFQEWVEREGFAYEAFRTDMHAFMNSESGKEWIENSSDSSLREAQNMKRMMGDVAQHMGEDLLRMAQDADVLVSGLPTFILTHRIAEKLNKRHFTIMLAPLNPTREADATMVPTVPRRKNLLNRIAGYIGMYFTYWIFKDGSNAYLSQIGAKGMNYGDYTRAYNREVPVFYGISPRVMPQPDDWKSTSYVTGYWFYGAPQQWEPSAALCDFLAAGQKPVYIGFGSMANKNPEATAALMIEALQKTGQRGIIHTGWAGLRAADVPENIFLLDEAPHDWLFPQMAAVVHHGGSGTTAAALRAGVPNTIVAHMADQPYWGRRVHELGIGAPVIRRHQLTAERLAQAIELMTTNPEIARKAQAIGAAIREEDGVAEAVKAFDQLLRRR